MWSAKIGQNKLPVKNTSYTLHVSLFISANVYGVCKKLQVHLPDDVTAHQLHAARPGGDVFNRCEHDVQLRLYLHPTARHTSP